MKLARSALLALIASVALAMAANVSNAETEGDRHGQLVWVLKECGYYDLAKEYRAAAVRWFGEAEVGKGERKLGGFDMYAGSCGKAKKIAEQALERDKQRNQKDEKEIKPAWKVEQEKSTKLQNEALAKRLCSRAKEIVSLDRLLNEAEILIAEQAIDDRGCDVDKALLTQQIRSSKQIYVQPRSPDSNQKDVIPKSSTQSTSQIKEAQRLLNLLGFHAGPEDGLYGPATAGAVKTFQRSVRLPVDGRIDGSLIKHLEKAVKAIHSQDSGVTETDQGSSSNDAVPFNPNLSKVDFDYEGDRACRIAQTYSFSSKPLTKEQREIAFRAYAYGNCMMEEDARASLYQKMGLE